MATVVQGDFEWDDAKADANLANHGVHPDRYILIGFSHGGHLLTVAHAERGERERIISAWRATAEEERLYTGR